MKLSASGRVDIGLLVVVFFAFLILFEICLFKATTAYYPIFTAERNPKYAAQVFIYVRVFGSAAPLAGLHRALSCRKDDYTKRSRRLLSFTIRLLMLSAFLAVIWVVSALLARWAPAAT